MSLIADIDCETYSEAGYYYDLATRKWRGVSPSGKGGLKEIGSAAYAEHPSTGLLLLAWDIKDGQGSQLWTEESLPPDRLFKHITNGGLVAAMHSMFEFFIWHYVCHLRMGWPPLPLDQLRDPAAAVRAHSVPGKLSEAGRILKADIQKQPDGARLIRKFCIPRSPTKKDPRLRIQLQDDPQDMTKFCSYNVGDIKSQRAVMDRVPELSPFELDLWKLDQRINARGVYVDRSRLKDCISIVNQAAEKYTSELIQITNGVVQTPNKLAVMQKWLKTNGLILPNMKAETIEDTLKRNDLLPVCRRVLEIRTILGSASVKKLFAIDRQLSSDGRLRELFIFCGGSRTGRWSGRATQPQNLKSKGPANIKEWGQKAIAEAFKIIASQNLITVEKYYTDPIDVVAGCLRGLFCAEAAHELLCSDFSAIEAVVAAFLAGEKWRMEVFRSHGKIYEASASKITKIPLSEFFAHKERTGNHHPIRSKIGKVAELASAYDGWINAWKNFGAADHFANDYEIKEAIKKWRDESPAIVEMWGGQWRKDPRPHSWSFAPELYGLEGAAVSAMLHPGKCFRYRQIAYEVYSGILYCRLPSGRCLTYHDPQITLVLHRYSKKPIYQLSYMGWNTNSEKGSSGWVRIYTRGGKLFENIVQAVARDILAYAMLAIDRANYPIVLHVHDEIVSEVLQGYGTIAEYERIMSTMPPWCKDWPIKATGGWRGQRFRKD